MKKSVSSNLIYQNLLTSPVVIDTQNVVLEKKHRCQSCSKLLGIEKLVLPSFDIKCIRCGTLNTVLKDYERQIIITDKNGVILYINEYVEKATGYSKEEVIGKTPAIWGSQMPTAFYQSMWNEIKDKKKAIVVKLTNKHKNGQLYSVILRISPMLDIHGKVEFFMGMETIVEETDDVLKKQTNNTY